MQTCHLCTSYLMYNIWLRTWKGVNVSKLSPTHWPFTWPLPRLLYLLDLWSIPLSHIHYNYFVLICVLKHAVCTWIVRLTEYSVEFRNDFHMQRGDSFFLLVLPGLHVVIDSVMCETLNVSVDRPRCPDLSKWRRAVRYRHCQKNSVTDWKY